MTNGTTAGDALDLDGPVPLHPLVHLAEGEDVTVGRRDTDVYLVMPPDGAETVRRLERGLTPREAAAWYHDRYGEPLDVADLVAALAGAGFVRADGEPPAAPPPPVRWQRLGTAVFSRPAMAGYACLLAWALVSSVRHPDLLPHYRHYFFTDSYYSVVQAVLLAAAVPLVLLHEAFHALAGRRLGLRSSLRMGRRLDRVVLETSMDGLAGIPRRRRVLPILAGMLADLLVIAVLTLAADLTRTPSGAVGPGGRVCLAVALAAWFRIWWQFSVFLETDLYVLFTAVLGCVDLHGVTKQLIRNAVHRLRGRPDRMADPSTWHPTDRRIARWYVWLVVAGYGVSLLVLALAVVPIVAHLARALLDRFTGPHPVTWIQVLDLAATAAFAVLQLVVVGLLALRDRRRAPSRTETS